MKSFWNWVIAFLIAPFVVALFIAAVWGAVAFGQWVLTLSNHVQEIMGALFVIGLVAIVVKEAEIPDLIMEWIEERRRN